MSEQNQNLWAPWRMEYIRSLTDDGGDGGCFLCKYWASPADDRANHVVWRTPDSFVVMNRFPYTNGHLLIAYAGHVGELDGLEPNALTDLTRTIRDAVGVLRRTLAPQGFNVGFNVGRCAGAGLPDHLHAHVVPRWSGDTNFMAVLGDVRMIPDALDALFEELKAAADAMNIGK